MARFLPAIRRSGTAEPVHEGTKAPSAQPVVAYALDCVVTGMLGVDEGRLSDVLATVQVVNLGDVVLQALEDGRRVEAGPLGIDVAELCVVAATGSRGDTRRRIRTRPELVVGRVGPYALRGFLHAAPTVDARATLSRRPFVPLTQATISYWAGGVVVEQEHEVLLLNRDHVQTLQVADERDSSLDRVLEALAP